MQRCTLLKVSINRKLRIWLKLFLQYLKHTKQPEKCLFLDKFNE